MKHQSKLTLLYFLLALGLAATAQAQLTWSSYATTGARVSANTGSYNSASGAYAFTVPANTTHTFVTTNFAPVTLAASQTKAVTFSLNATGGFGASGAPIINQRCVAYGLFNYGSTAPGATGAFTDDVGLWTSIYQQTSGIAMEFFGGTSSAANLLTYTSTKSIGGATGPAAGAVGQFVDGSTSNVTYRVSESSGGVASIGTGTTTATAGVWYSDTAGGTIFNRTGYSGNATTPAGATTFNEFGFMFINTTASPVTVTLGSVSGLTPIFATQPAPTVTTAGSNVTISAAAPTATAFQWQKSTDGGTNFSNVSGATSATLSFTNVQASDAATYRVVATTPDSSHTSTNATLTVVTTAANGTAGLNWSSYNTSGNRVSATAAIYDNSTGTYTFTIPASTTHTLATTNFAPLTLAASQTQTLTYTMTASGGFGPAGTPVQNQRFIAYGLFNFGATAPGATGQFTDDLGLWTSAYQQTSGIAAEVFGGTSSAANLLANQGTTPPKLGAGAGPAAGAIGQFVDGSATNVTFRVVENASGTASIGTGTTTATAGALYQDAATSGTTFNRTIYSAAAATPSGTTTFNEFAFLFNNTTASSVTLALKNITGVIPPPFITAQPPTTSAGTTNGSVSLSVTATTSGGSLAYQWQKSTDSGVIFNNIDPYAGNASAGTATLTLSNLQLSDAGIFRVLVTNVAGTVISNNAALTVTAGVTAPSITTQPSSSTVLVGAAASFSVVASGSTPLTYQWRKSTDGTTYIDISGATSATYSIASAALTDTGYYRAVVTNSAGSATSNAAILTVNQAPSISAQPVGATLNVGAVLTLSVTATGTPAPTFQWKKNGANIPGATSSTYSIASVTGGDTANYAVVVTNSAGTVTSAIAAVAVLSPTLAATTVTPTSAATGRNPDTRLAITFNTAVTPGVSGFLRIYDASNNAVVDTIDFATATALRDTLRATSTVSTLNLPVQNKSIGGTTNFNYYPLTVSGNTVTIYPRDGVLAYNKSYYVKIDAGAFVNSAGEAYGGINDTSTWTFGTKAAGPTAGATAVVVAADSTGDFDTVQGAIDWVPATNAAPLTISIKNGSYFEEIAFINKNFLTLVGQDRTQTTIVYPNNNNFNNVSGGIYHRATFIASGVNNITVQNLKFHNTTPQGGSQAEAFILSGTATFTARNLVTKCSFYSYQDTIQLNKQCYISDSYIEGDTDFMWGSGPCFFSNCDIKMVQRTGGYFAQVRNTTTNHGFVYANCRFTSDLSSNYLNRIDPTGFPNCEVVLINSKIGDATNNAFLNTTVGVSSTDYKAGWWLLNGTTSPTALTANIRNWDYNTVDGNNAPLTFAARPAFTVMPTDATTIANFSDPFWVLNTTWAGVSSGTWTPSVLPTFLAQPQGQTVAVGTAVTLTVDVAAVPAATYQWFLNDSPIGGATASSYSLPSVSGADWGTYKVVATTTGGNATSNLVSLTPAGSPTSNPTADPDGDGFSNLVEYSFGTDQAISSSAAITYAGGVLSVRGQPTISVTNITNGVDFRAVFGRRRNFGAAGLTYTVQFSANNLANWVNSSATPTVLATDGVIDAVSVPYPLFIATPNGVEKPKFFRVGVSSN